MEFHPGAWENPRLRLPASLQPHGACAERQHGPSGLFAAPPVLLRAGRWWPPWAVRLHPPRRSGRTQRTIPITLINTTYKLLMKLPGLFPQFFPCSGLCKVLKAPTDPFHSPQRDPTTLMGPWSPPSFSQLHRASLSSRVSPESRDLKVWIQFLPPPKTLPAICRLLEVVLKKRDVLKEESHAGPFSLFPKPSLAPPARSLPTNSPCCSSDFLQPHDPRMDFAPHIEPGNKSTEHR